MLYFKTRTLARAYAKAHNKAVMDTSRGKVSVNGSRWAVRILKAA